MISVNVFCSKPLITFIDEFESKKEAAIWYTEAATELAEQSEDFKKVGSLWNGNRVAVIDTNTPNDVVVFEAAFIED